MKPDPIFDAMYVNGRRFLWFVVLAAGQATALWLRFWMHFKHLTLWESCSFITSAWPLSLDDFPSFVAMAFVWVGIANTSIIYLLLGRWWKKRAEVLHRRGTIFVDQREGK